jgi:hypothetical protein
MRTAGHHRSTSPFRAEMGAAGRSGTWECSSERAGAGRRGADGRHRPAGHPRRGNRDQPPALATEADRLQIRPGSIVLTITRVDHTAERPVETSDIIIPVDRYALVYQVPVR